MDHPLSAAERQRARLDRFRRFPVPAAALESYLGQNLFLPTQVRDYGEVPSFYRHFEEADTTVEIGIEPILNDHYADDTPRRIEWVSFCDTNFVHGTLYRLGQVDPAIMAFVLQSMANLIRESSAYLYNGPVDAEQQLILAHGASVPMDAAFMDYMAEGVAAHGIRVVRFEFPYMQRWRCDGRKRPPNSTNVLEKCWLEVVEAHGGGRNNVIGGKSLGGRIAARIAARSEARGLVCLGYPFHPRGDPQALRIEHLQAITIPTLILQGSRDPFGRREDVVQYPLSPHVKLVWLEGGNHSFKPPRDSRYTQLDHWASAVESMADFLADLP
jgi:predicted alpha/beta-hydrolase family hydrolase